ncbi:MAG: HupE/UreJ family protein [Myxococcales bacterium]|nr:HupE/UreJ family protein [Myxococcales bacterium]
MSSRAKSRPVRRMHLALVSTSLVMLSLVWAGTVYAHRVGLSSGKYVSDGTNVDVTVTIRRDDLRSGAPALDADKDGSLSDAELVVNATTDAAIVPLIDAQRGLTPCAGKLTKLVPDGGDGLDFTLRFEACTGDSSVLNLDIAKLVRGAGTGHRHAGEIDVPAELPKPPGVLAHADASRIDVPLTSPTGTDAPAPPAPPPPAHASVAKEMFVLGVEHIWTGIDHIVFLLGLVMLGGTLKDLLKTVTAFTISHSITLALAVLGVVAPSPNLVEPVIALSVAYVGLENFFVKDTSKRWRIAAAFGFIHGFGFAGALGEIALPKASIPLALGMFNVGVEAGQLVLLLGIVPLFAFLRKQTWFSPKGMWAVSGAIVAVGLFWFVERVAFA